MTILELREKIPVDVFGSMELKFLPGTYANLQAKIDRLVARGELMRLKRGLYTFCEQLRRDKVLDSGFIAGQIYGPSYLSADAGNALREIMQELALSGLAHARFLRQGGFLRRHGSRAISETASPKQFEHRHDNCRRIGNLQNSFLRLG